MSLSVRMPGQAGPAPPNTTLMITSNPTLPSGTVNVAYSYQFLASGGKTPYSWSGTTLPTGLTLSAAGVLSGTPTSAASWSGMAITVTDSATPTANTDHGTFTLVIAAGVTPPPSGSLVHGSAFTARVNGTGTKSGVLAPIIRDMGTHAVGTIDPQWIAARPALTGEINSAWVANAMQIQPLNFNPHGSGCGAPHQNLSGIYAGTAYDGAVVTGTPNWTYERFLRWQISLASTIQSGDTQCLYARWYECNDPAWNLAASAGAQNNKLWGYGPYGYADTGPGESSAQSYILNFNNDKNTPGNNTDLGYQVVLANNNNDGHTILEYPDRNGHGQWWGARANPYNFAKWGWQQVELEMCIDTNSGATGHGYLNYIINGQRSSNNSNYQGAVVHYAGRTDNYMYVQPQTRNLNFGAGMYGVPINDPTTTSLLADFYCDMSLGATTGQTFRVIVGDKPAYADCKIVAPQVITAMVGVSGVPGEYDITFTAAKDQFITGATGYIYVQAESGTVLSGGSATWA